MYQHMVESFYREELVEDMEDFLYSCLASLMGNNSYICKIDMENHLGSIAGTQLHRLELFEFGNYWSSMVYQLNRLHQLYHRCHYLTDLHHFHSTVTEKLQEIKIISWGERCSILSPQWKKLFLLLLLTLKRWTKKEEQRSATPYISTVTKSSTR